MIGCPCWSAAWSRIFVGIFTSDQLLLRRFALLEYFFSFVLFCSFDVNFDVDVSLQSSTVCDALLREAPAARLWYFVSCWRQRLGSTDVQLQCQIRNAMCSRWVDFRHRIGQKCSSIQLCVTVWWFALNVIGSRWTDPTGLLPYSEVAE